MSNCQIGQDGRSPEDHPPEPEGRREENQNTPHDVSPVKSKAKRTSLAGRSALSLEETVASP